MIYKNQAPVKKISKTPMRGGTESRPNADMGDQEVNGP